MHEEESLLISTRAKACVEAVAVHALLSVPSSPSINRSESLISRLLLGSISWARLMNEV